MRKGFDGLAYLVQSVLAEDPLSGHLFVFRNRRGDRLKILYWAGDGFALWYRRLEKGTFRFPTPSEAEATGIPVKAADLLMLLEGVDLESLRRRPRYVRHPA
jgi:transposase